MSKPIISKFSVIDARADAIISYVCYDANPTKLNYIIYDNESGNIIVTKSITLTGTASIRTFTLPANTVQNRLEPYYIKIQTVTSSAESDLSDAVLFYCHEKPSISITNASLSSVTTIPFSSYLFVGNYTYNTKQSETLTRYKWCLYDANKRLVATKTYYGDLTKDFKVTGFDNNSTYYVRIIGTSVNGYTVDSGYYELVTSLSEKVEETSLDAVNMETYGIIRLIASLQAPTSNTYDTVRVKRRLYGSYAWTILGEWDASGFDDTINVIFEDAYALGRYKLYEYTIVPVCDGVERDSETILVESNFHGAIIADIDTLYVINLDPEITSVTRNVDTAVEKTLAGKYPIVSYGNEANYYTGSFSGTILKWDADTDTYDFEQSVEYREELIDWLTNTKPKVLKI